MPILGSHTRLTAVFPVLGCTASFNPSSLAAISVHRYMISVAQYRANFIVRPTTYIIGLDRWRCSVNCAIVRGLDNLLVVYKNSDVDCMFRQGIVNIFPRIRASELVNDRPVYAGTHRSCNIMLSLTVYRSQASMT